MNIKTYSYKYIIYLKKEASKEGKEIQNFTYIYVKW